MKAAVFAILLFLFVAEASAIGDNNVKTESGSEVSELSGLSAGKPEIAGSINFGNEFLPELVGEVTLNEGDTEADGVLSSNDELSIMLENALDAMGADLNAEISLSQRADNALPSQVSVELVAGSLGADNAATEAIWVEEPEVAVAGSAVAFPRAMPLMRGGPLALPNPLALIPGRVQPAVSMPIPLGEILSILSSISGVEDGDQVVIISSDSTMMPDMSSSDTIGKSLGWNDPDDDEDDNSSSEDVEFASLEDHLLSGIQSTLAADLLGPDSRDLDAYLARRAADRKDLRARVERAHVMDRLLGGGAGAGGLLSAREVQREMEAADAEEAARAMSLPLLLGGLLETDASSDSASRDAASSEEEDDDDWGFPLMGFGPLDCLAHFMGVIADDLFGKAEPVGLDAGPFGPFFRPSFRSGGPFPQLRPRPQVQQVLITPFGPLRIGADGSLGGAYDDGEERDSEGGGEDGTWASMPIRFARPFLGERRPGEDAGPAREGAGGARRSFDSPRRLWGPREGDTSGQGARGMVMGDRGDTHPQHVGMWAGHELDYARRDAPTLRRAMPGNLRPHPPSALHHAFDWHPLAFFGLLSLATALVLAVAKVACCQQKACAREQAVVSICADGMQAPLLTTTRVVAVSLPYVPVNSPTDPATSAYVPPQPTV